MTLHKFPKKGNFISRQNWKIGRTIVIQISKKGNILFLSNWLKRNVCQVCGACGTAKIIEKISNK